MRNPLKNIVGEEEFPVIGNHHDLHFVGKLLRDDLLNQHRIRLEDRSLIFHPLGISGSSNTDAVRFSFSQVVLALDFRGYGKSRGPGDSDPMDAPLHLDVLAAVRYLHKMGAKSVSIIGGSMGGSAAGDASIASRPAEIDRLVFLGAAPNGPADQLKSPTLFIVARDDANGDGPRLPGIRKQYEKAPEPKQLIILDGAAHAQFLFQTDQADRVMHEILRFLSAK